MEELLEHAAEAAAVLKLLANQNRLLVLCHLLDSPLNVAQLNRALPFLSQSALSQHLARLRQAGIVSCRPHGAAMVYSIADDRVRTLLFHLRDLYCRPEQAE